jgi:hypothetical protein
VTTYTPTTSNQTIAAGTYCSGAQTIKGDANLKAENIAEGVSIFGVTGTHSGGSGGSGGGGVETLQIIVIGGTAFSDGNAEVDVVAPIYEGGVVHTTRQTHQTTHNINSGAFTNITVSNFIKGAPITFIFPNAGLATPAALAGDVSLLYASGNIISFACTGTDMCAIQLN